MNFSRFLKAPLVAAAWSGHCPHGPPAVKAAIPSRVIAIELERDPTPSGDGEPVRRLAAVAGRRAVGRTGGRSAGALLPVLTRTALTLSFNLLYH